MLRSQADERLQEERLAGGSLEEVISDLSKELFSLSGEQYFQALAVALTERLGVDFAFVGEVEGEIGPDARIRILAFAENGRLGENITYALVGTPCEGVISNELCSISGVRQKFPKDPMLVDLAIESYLGAPLVSTAGQVLGLIGVMHRQTLMQDRLIETVLRIFIHQAAAELERWRGAVQVSALTSFHEQLLEHIPLDLAVFDLKGRYQYINANAVKDPEMRRWLVGKTELEYCRRRRLDVEQAHRRAFHREQVLANRQPCSFEEIIRDRQGKERCFLRCFVPVFGSDGEIRQVIGYGLDITERKRTEKDLEDSEAIYRAMFEGNRAVKLLLDPETAMIVDANPAASDFYGYSRDELRRMKITDINIRPKAEVRELVRRIGQGELSVLRTRHRLKSGEVRDIEAHAGPLEIRGRRLIFSIIQDVSDRCRAEEALREREQYFRSIIHHSLDVITILDRDGKVTFESPSVEWVTGYSPEERLGQLAMSYIHPEDQAAFEILLEPQPDWSGPAPSIEARCRHKRGGWRVCDFRASHQLDDPAVRGIVMHSRDVTERQRAEDAVRKSEEKYRRLFEQSKDVVYMSSPDGRLLDINQAGMKLLGFTSKEELLKVDLSRDVYAEPQQRHKLLAELTEKGFVRDYELKLKMRGSEISSVLVTSSAVKDEKGQIIAYLGILRDVSLQRQLEDQLRQSQKMEAVGRLAGGLAHDFNNLLTAINGYGELLQRQLPKDDPRRTYIDEICNAGSRAADLTGKLLTLSRRKVVSPRVVDLNRMVQQLQNLLRRLIGEDIELVTELDPGLDRVRVDPGQMEQVVLNLAINARDAMPSGGRLTLATRKIELANGYPQSQVGPGPCARLSVTDTGIGMDTEILQHIFEPFYTTKGQGKGTGLGLSTAYATVQQCGGHITVESTPGQGTTFHIFLPPVDGTITREIEVPVVVEPSKGDETILLVEDDPAVRRLVHRILDQQGYHVLEASNPRAALELVDSLEGRIDLLVSDVVMPMMSGPDLAQKIVERRPGVRILFISGYTDDRFKGQHGLSESEHVVLQKPFSAQVLSEKIREILDTAK